MAIKRVVVDDAPPSMELKDITPEYADELLAKLHHNFRTVRWSTVDAYARDMKKGKWRVTGESVKISPTGELVDGQHRLRAVVKSGRTVKMFVAHGIDADAEKVLDTGVRRSTADMLMMEGYKNAIHVAGAARLAMLFKTGDVGESKRRSIRITNAEVMEFLDVNPDLMDAVTMGVHYRRTIDLPPSTLSVMWWILVQVDSDACEEFFASLANHTTNGEGDPRNALIQRLTSARRINERISQEAQISLTFRAWNAWRKDQRLVKMPIRNAKDSDLISIPTPV